MKKNIIILLFTSFFSCLQSDAETYSVTEVQNEHADCDQSVPFGNIDVCLPKIEGMVECYSSPMLKEFVDNFNYEGNSILAFYLNQSDYEGIDNLEELGFDDYFQIYVTDVTKNMKLGQAELNQLAQMFEDSHYREDWVSYVKNREKLLRDVSLNGPIILEGYSPKKEIRSYVTLMSFKGAEQENTVVAMMNMVLIKERFVWVAYFKQFEGEKSIQQAKQKNESIVLQLLSDNK